MAGSGRGSGSGAASGIGRLRAPEGEETVAVSILGVLAGVEYY